MIRIFRNPSFKWKISANRKQNNFTFWNDTLVCLNLFSFCNTTLAFATDLVKVLCLDCWEICSAHSQQWYNSKQRSAEKKPRRISFMKWHQMIFLKGIFKIDVFTPDGLACLITVSRLRIHWRSFMPASLEWKVLYL